MCVPSWIFRSGLGFCFSQSSKFIRFPFQSLLTELGFRALCVQAWICRSGLGFYFVRCLQNSFIFLSSPFQQNWILELCVSRPGFSDLGLDSTVLGCCWFWLLLTGSFWLDFGGQPVLVTLQYKKNTSKKIWAPSVKRSPFWLLLAGSFWFDFGGQPVLVPLQYKKTP